MSFRPGHGRAPTPMCRRIRILTMIANALHCFGTSLRSLCTTRQTLSSNPGSRSIGILFASCAARLVRVAMVLNLAASVARASSPAASSRQTPPRPSRYPVGPTKRLPSSRFRPQTRTTTTPCPRRRALPASPCCSCECRRSSSATAASPRTGTWGASPRERGCTSRGPSSPSAPRASDRASPPSPRRARANQGRWPSPAAPSTRRARSFEMAARGRGRAAGGFQCR